MAAWKELEGVECVALFNNRAADATKLSRALTEAKAKLDSAKRALEGRGDAGRAGSLSPVGDILAELKRIVDTAVEVTAPRRGDGWDRAVCVERVHSRGHGPRSLPS